LVTVTVAPTSTPPVVSVTMPVICPNVWAKDGTAARSKKLSTTMHSNVLRMDPPHFVKAVSLSVPAPFVHPVSPIRRLLIFLSRHRDTESPDAGGVPIRVENAGAS